MSERISTGRAAEGERAQCSRCHFWLRLSLQGVAIRLGECRRYPPVSQPEKGFEYRSPQTMDDFWCGEYAARRAAESAGDGR